MGQQNLGQKKEYISTLSLSSPLSGYVGVVVVDVDGEGYAYPYLPASLQLYSTENAPYSPIIRSLFGFASNLTASTNS